MPDALFDVVAVNIATGRVRLLATGKDRRNADAVVKMAVMRRGVEREFFMEVPAGSYHKEGDKCSGQKEEKSGNH